MGSQQWIGSIELGYCLENMAGIESRVLTTNSGMEVAGNIRQLALHFETYGTPVMIGKFQDYLVEKCIIMPTQPS